MRASSCCAFTWEVKVVHMYSAQPHCLQHVKVYRKLWLDEAVCCTKWYLCLVSHAFMDNVWNAGLLFSLFSGFFFKFQCCCSPSASINHLHSTYTCSCIVCTSLHRAGFVMVTAVDHVCAMTTGIHFNESCMY